MDNQRSLKEIAEEIIRDWNPPSYLSYYDAIPYLDEMRTMTSIDDQERALDAVSHFLCNAALWRGPTARRIKKELRAMIMAQANGYRSGGGR